jgi:hypothetical protein
MFLNLERVTDFLLRISMTRQESLSTNKNDDILSIFSVIKLLDTLLLVFLMRYLFLFFAFCLSLTKKPTYIVHLTTIEVFLPSIFLSYTSK